MCGIAGVLDPKRSLPAEALRGLVRRMSLALAHRGPDDEGVYVDAGAGLALGHRRLAVLDLSRAGAQPMSTSDGRLTLVFNGEIYNFQELRLLLEKSPGFPGWRGTSDTEVLLEAVAAWGLDTALDRCRGMFALALWSARERTLTLARDRLGEKPLYYGRLGGLFAFASELKALRVLPGVSPDLDRESLALYLRLSCVPAPRSIYRDVRKLPPGCLLRLTPDSEGLPEPQTYWSLAATVEAALADPFTGSEEEAADALEALLKDAVRGQMVADVPLAAFLSGGVDSSLVTALMQAQSPRPVKTFTVTFAEAAYDEGREAARVARALGTDHNALFLAPGQALEAVADLPEIFDEPLGDASMLPAVLVSRLVRRQVTVCLTGDGGNELFAGYNRHVWGPLFWRSLGRAPGPLRRLLAAGIRAVPPAVWDALLGRLPRVPRSPGLKLHKLARALPASGSEDLYRRLVTVWPKPQALLLDGRTPKTLLERSDLWPRGQGLAGSMQFLDAACYLPDDVLVKVDRAAMAAGLEPRAPFLDHRVAALAWRLPLSMKVAGGQGKRILRRILARYLPEELCERSRAGFGLPLDSWLRGPLQNWARALLDPARLRRQGLLQPEPVKTVLDQHLSGRRDRQQQLWNVLMLQAWLERWM